MTDLLLTNEPLIRVAFFLSILLALAVWEVGAPHRRREIPRLIRWSNNFGLVVLDTLLVRLTFPVVAVGLALTAQARGWGLLNVLDVPGWGRDRVDPGARSVTSASTCPGGIGCSAPIGRSPATGMTP